MARGTVLAIAGQIGWNAQGIFKDSFVEQFDQALENVIAVLIAAQGQPSDLVRFTIFITDKSEYLDQLRAIGAIYKKHMGSHYPAMSLVVVAALLENKAKVEIEATAVIP